jgi:hypothetical protein
MDRCIRVADSLVSGFFRHVEFGFGCMGLFLETTKGYTEALELGVQRQDGHYNYRVISSFLKGSWDGKRRWRRTPQWNAEAKGLAQQWTV